MRIALYTSVISPHQLPLARALVERLGDENFRYIYWKEVTQERRQMGWFDGVIPQWTIKADTEEARQWEDAADLLLFSGWFNLEVLERRTAQGNRSLYLTERWFKPPVGWLRLLFPKYRKIARRIGRLIDSGLVTVCPIGMPAARELAILYAHRSLGEVERVPLGKVLNITWMRMWGYFVAPSNVDKIAVKDAHRSRKLHVLWVGRLLSWKRVDTIVRAVATCLDRIPIELTIVGDGPEKQKLQKLAERLCRGYREAIRFLPSISIPEVREVMRQHDVYVLSSNGYEGWGAVVSEALEEGMEVFGTYEAGSASMILPWENLFRAGDLRTLSSMLLGYSKSREPHCVGIGLWSAMNAAESIISIAN